MKFNKKHILIYILIAGILFTLPACSDGPDTSDTQVSASATPTKSPNFKAPDMPANMEHEPPQGMRFEMRTSLKRVITPFNIIRSQAHTSSGHRQTSLDLT